MSNQPRFAVFLAYALVIWAICGAIMMVGLALTSEQNALIAHAIGAPIVAAAVSWVFFRRYEGMTPVLTAAFFVSTIIVMDFFLVAMFIERSLEMFTSALGTWIPFTLIFAATYLTGRFLRIEASRVRVPR